MLSQVANQQLQHFYKNASIQIRSLVYKTRYEFKRILFLKKTIFFFLKSSVYLC